MRKHIIKPIVIACIIVIIGTVISYSLSQKVKLQLKQQDYLKLKNKSEQISIYFQEAIDIAVNDIQALQAFYSAADTNHSYDEFKRYMDIINIDDRKHIQALSWAPLIQGEQRSIHELNIQKRFPNYSIKERLSSGDLVKSAYKNSYTPVAYISPYQINKAAHGFDLSSNLTRLKSLELVKNSGKITTTAKINLVQEKEDSYGFLLIAPVYEINDVASHTPQFKESLLGYVTGVFRINNLIENANRRANKAGLKLSLIDEDINDGGLLYGALNDIFYDSKLTVPDRVWTLRISLSSELSKNLKSSFLSSLILISGIIISILLALSFYALQISMIRNNYINSLHKKLEKNNQRLELTVKERTHKITETNDLLNVHIEELKKQQEIQRQLIFKAKQSKSVAEEKAIELARSNKDLDEFAYVASHDLKAPLRGIDQLAKWIVEDLKEGNLEEIPENLDLIRNRVQRLEKLLTDLLLYSKVNRQQHIFSQINTHQLVVDTYNLLGPPSDFRLIIDKKLPTINTVSIPLEQIIRNLLDNAIKHHHRTDGEIIVKCTEEKLFYEFSFEDNGLGIDSQYHEDVFKMFKTLKPRDEVEGSGMGLSLIKKIVEYHKGSISLQSSVGKGCTITFTWPKFDSILKRIDHEQ